MYTNKVRYFLRVLNSESRYHNSQTATVGGVVVADSWYYSDKNGPIGPFTLQELRESLVTIPNASIVLVWRNGFSGWKLAKDVVELGWQTTPPPVSSIEIGNPEPHADAQTSTSQHQTPVVGIVGAGLGLASVAALICSVIALTRHQKGWGISGLLLGFLGVAGITYTSQQIADIFHGNAGRVSLPQPAFAPPPNVTQQKYDQIQVGMTYQQARSIVGVSGEELSRSDMAGISTACTPG